MRFLVGLLALGVFVPLMARGSGPSPLAFGLYQGIQRDNPVESQTDAATNAEHAPCPGGFSWWPCDDTYWPRTDGQPTGATWVVNHTGCSWDPDDHEDFLGTGYLNPGASGSVTYCLVAEPSGITRTVFDQTADWSISPKINSFIVKSASPDLRVTACYSPQDRCFTLFGRPLDKSWIYSGCIRLQYHEGDPLIQPIPDSGKGGLGLVTRLTFTVTNPTRRKAQNILAFTNQDNGAMPCQPPTPYVWDYPFQVAL